MGELNHEKISLYDAYELFEMIADDLVHRQEKLLEKETEKHFEKYVDYREVCNPDDAFFQVVDKE